MCVPGQVPTTRRGAEPLNIAPYNEGTMGNYVLYLLMQAFVALIFAYFSGTLVFQNRKLHMLMVSLGFYLLMGSALMELWGDRAGWEAWALGLNVALVATSVALMGAGGLLKDAPDMSHPVELDMLAKVLAGASILMGAVLASTAGWSDSVVDAGGIAGAEISGAFDHLGPVGWVLASTLFIGSSLLIWLGIRTSFVLAQIRGLWYVGAGILFLLWPFNIHLGGLPLSPSFMMLALAMAYFGFAPTKELEGGTGEDDGDVDGEDEETKDGGPEGLAPWVREAIADKGPEDEDLDPADR